MARKKISKASKRSLLLFGSISLVIIGYFVFNLFTYAYNIYTLKSEEKKLSIELNNLQHDEKLLKTEIEKLKDPDYIARYARENYQYSKDGEIILNIKKTEKKEEINKNNIEYDYILKVGSGILFVIFIYVIIKSSKKDKKK